MFAVFKFIKSLILWKGRMREERLRQTRGGYTIDMEGTGPETYITYSENGRTIGVIADFSWGNDVVLFTDSLRKWMVPYGVELTDFDFQKVLNRVTNYLACWGEVTLNNSKLPDNEDLKRSLTEQGIEFEELPGGVIHYSLNADDYREQLKKGKL
jgi:hypothetical protein